MNQHHARFTAALTSELRDLVTNRMSAGDRASCYAMELFFYPDQDPFGATVFLVDCVEAEVEHDPEDLELRWNHAALSPAGDRAALPRQAETKDLLARWQASVGVPEGWFDATGANSLSATTSAEHRALADLVVAGWFDALVASVQALHRHGEIDSLFGRPTPFIISSLTPDLREAVATVESNGRERSASFLRYLGLSHAPAIDVADRRFQDAMGAG